MSPLAVTNPEANSNADAPQADARERLLDAAEALIYAGGIHATGVDAIVRAAGAARKSFYAYFESKNALVAAALARRDERWMRWFVAGTLAHGRTPRARLVGMFDVLREWFVSEGFHGCAFLNAAGEIASPDDPVRVVAREHKARLLDFVREQGDAWAASVGADRRTAARLARQWLILIDGAIGVALVSGDADAALDARAAGRSLLDALAPKSDSDSLIRSPSRAPSRRAAQRKEQDHE
ncbi:TetR/AcrR family transcriptional regulator [Paraburkholderia silvatlantica]|uniref:Transcriptional regulator, TetR family n=2 Tax=cellular organisms TaxID=131567 RepID=W2TXM7_NECAM|nr:TetR/AcrR family transcriptional regulator [Paraburkholderia silvatlantica]XP_013308661.1 transcriptional regulator, TetR family [Necator americanus]ETN86434.1 transcriptional regulator, TetR family [Necator americanus]MBB2928655.1 AcrR family transcriptional regulator [Paraburkholderia silvatlantica]PVY35241.1 TetR family transcriptional regulator [Paraburkholderia silvatlantica]PXW40883.1 TetR family transcriptional regulator [Paraburkholderia silvatlantica]TDQ98291.1 TetR family transcr